MLSTREDRQRPGLDLVVLVEEWEKGKIALLENE